MKPFITLFCLFLALPSFAQSDKGNGGDTYAQEYAAIARRIYQAGCEKTKLLEAFFDCHALDVSMSGFTYKSQKMVLGPDGAPRDAINFYPNSCTITLGRLAWKTMTPYAKFANVLHEISALMGKEKSDQYDFSNLIIEIFKSNHLNLDEIAQVNVLDTSLMDLFNQQQAALLCDTGVKDSLGHKVQIQFGRPYWLISSSAGNEEHFLYPKKFVRAPEYSIEMKEMDYDYDLDEGQVIFSLKGHHTWYQEVPFMGRSWMLNEELRASGTSDAEWSVSIELSLHTEKASKEIQFSDLHQSIFDQMKKEGTLTQEKLKWKLQFNHCHLN